MNFELRPASVLWVILVCLLAGAATAAHADDKTAGWTITGGPRDDLYPRYIADPKRTTFGLRRMRVSDSEIADAGAPRFGLNLGARVGLFRVHPRSNPDRGLQADLEVGFMAQFDSDNSTDNIGWDGIYALLFSFKSNEIVQFRFGLHHISSHLGDEYVERTGRLRLDYTREEYLAGVAFALGERAQAYVEGGHAYDRRNRALQKHGRIQVGLQYEAPPSVWKNRLGWYVALDLSAYEERDWNINAALQAGFVLPNDGQKWRLGIELYDGRSTMGEFFLEDETYVNIGVWLDL